MTDSGNYIEKVSEYYATSGYNAVSVAQESMYTHSAYEQSVDSLFSIIPGINTKEIFSIFAAIRRPNGVPFINMTSFEEVMEVINLCVEIGISSAAQELTELAKNPESSIPWSISLIKPFQSAYKRSIDLEFMGIEGRKRPISSPFCPRCGHDRIFSSVGITRSLDEGLTSVSVCAACPEPFHG
jgi:DNA-directed RNA polymerase subunit M/transcription elongation factor TFIIS